MSHTQSTYTTLSQYVTGQLLIAMPTMLDPRFKQTVIYICTHTSEGAMGLVINRLFETVYFNDLLSQLDIQPSLGINDIRVHYGGPMESSRGFVLHTSDFVHESTMSMHDGVFLTVSVDVLKAMANGNGPKSSLLALGYAGWGPGQLDSELQTHSWLNMQADPVLVFDPNIETKWERSITKMGINIASFSGEYGHA